MTTVLLIRHATCDHVGRALSGRRPGVHLNDEGRAQARALAARLAGAPLSAVYSSPLERAQETAVVVAEPHGLPVRTAEAFAEIDYGGWTGKSIDELDGVPLWSRFNSYRSGTRAPDGELMLEVQARVAGGLERLRAEYDGGLVAVVSHGDAIRAALLHLAGMPLDHFLRLDVQPASMSIVELADWGPRILRLNDTGALPWTAP